MSLVMMLLYSFLCNLVVFFKLNRSVTSSPMDVYNCAPSNSAYSELEASSSDIRIESEDEVESAEETHALPRERMESNESEEMAGLPIYDCLFQNVILFELINLAICGRSICMDFVKENTVHTFSFVNEIHLRVFLSSISKLTLC